MIHIKTLTSQDDPEVEKINKKMEAMFGGMAPKVFTAMNLRTDLLEIILQYVNKLMIEDNGNSRFNYLDRMADATGAPVEHLQEMMASMT